MQIQLETLWRSALTLALALALNFGAFPAGPVQAADVLLYVDASVAASGDGTSWAQAYKTLPEALAVTNANGATTYEVWVAAGTYYPGAARTDSFRIERNNVQLYGGFAGTETAREQRDWDAHPTILSGDIGTPDDNADNAYHVVRVYGATYENITGSTVIDGFTIAAGNANQALWPNNAGGGLLCDGSGLDDECSPTLTNVTFSGNSATSKGGGMYNAGSGGVSRPTLTNVTFSGNSAAEGGGMYNSGGYGGDSSPTLTNVTFSGNSATSRGGGMYNDGATGVSSPTLTNVTFSGNSATSSGGGIYNTGGSGVSSPTLTNCILWGNTATTSGPQIYNSSATPTTAYSLIEGECPAGTTCGDGMLYTNPLFTDAVGGNLRLEFGSPAIDAGDNAAVPAGVTTDLDGLPRFADGNDDTFATVDMGAYEAGAMVCSVAQDNTYTFPSQSGVSIEVTTLGSELVCLYVDEMGLDHPHATGESGDSGLKTGRYWLIRGLLNDKTTEATGFTVNLTLPHSNLPNPKVCRYTAGAGYGWECAADGSSAATVWRNGVTAFSNWAVGQNVGPTALTLRGLAARGGLWGIGGLAGLLLLGGAATCFRRRRR